MARLAHSKSMFSTWVSAFVGTGSIACGYSTAIPSTTLAQPSFAAYMKLATLSNATQLIGAVNGCFIAGALIGSFSSSWSLDILGRKMAIFVAASIAVIGGALQAGSVDMGMFIAARLICGLGIGSLFAVVPLYQSEVSAPDARGMTVGFHGLFITVGYVTSNFVGLGFYFVNASGAQWRIPLAIQCVPVLVCATGICFMPESPRWLINKERHEEALKIVQRLHRNKDDPDHEFAHREYLQIKEQHDENEKNKVTWKQMFTTPAYRKRVALGILVMFGSQMTATLIVAIYNPVLYSSLGYGTVQQLLFAGGYSLVALAGNTFNCFTVDRIGRVRALKIGWVGDVCAMIGICAALSTFQRTGSQSSAVASIVFLFLHIAFFAGCVDVTTYVYTSEIFPNNIRGKGMSLSVTAYFVALVIELDSAPTAFAKIGWRLILIYLCCLAICVVPLFVYCHETKKLSLEEVAEMFGDRQTHTQLLVSDGGGDREPRNETSFVEKNERHEVESTRL